MGRAIVIGAGPVGLAASMLLARRGVEVVALDRDEPAPDTPERAWDSWERRVLAVAAEHEPYRTPAPTRAELEALLA